MFGINITAVDWASWIIAIVVTIYVAGTRQNGIRTSNSC